MPLHGAEEPCAREPDGPVLVTGGGGFIGTHLVRRLLAARQRVRIFELPELPPGNLPARRVEWVQGDIRRPDDLRRAMAGCAVVLHLAANPDLWVRRRRDFDQVNHQGTRHALRAAAEAGVRRFVHVSTESILTRPRATGQNGHAKTPPAARAGEEPPDGTNKPASADLDHAQGDSVLPPEGQMLGAYCRSKWRAERAAQEAAQAGLPVVIVNPTVPVGPGDRRGGPLSRLLVAFARGQVKGFLEGEINLIDVRDAAAGIWAAAQRGQIGRRYLLAHETWTYSDLFAALSKLTGRPPPRFRVPYPAALAYAWAEEQLGRLLNNRRPLATVTGVRLTRHSFCFDGSASARELGLTFRPCHLALGDALEWFAAQGVIPAPRPLDRAALARRDG